MERVHELDPRRVAGATYCAFFDVDGTLINTRSLLGILDYHVRASLRWDDQPWLEQYSETLGTMVAEGRAREELNAFYYTAYRGMTESAVTALGAEWFELASQNGSRFCRRRNEWLNDRRKEAIYVVSVLTHPEGLARTFSAGRAA